MVGSNVSLVDICPKTSTQMNTNIPKKSVPIATSKGMFEVSLFVVLADVWAVGIDDITVSLSTAGR